jgi:hypothetical protein
MNGKGHWTLIETIEAHLAQNRPAQNRLAPASDDEGS